MWKILLALNLLCVMFFSGCNKANISELGEENICGNSCSFEFSVLKNTFFNIESFPVPSAGRITFLMIMFLFHLI